MAQLHCPICGGKTTWVIETRATKAGLRRRRQCADYKHRFTTLETTVLTDEQALALEIERKAEELQNLLERADGLRLDIAQLRQQQEENAPEPEPQSEPAEEPISSDPVVITSLQDFRQLDKAGRAEAFEQALARARARIERENGNVPPT